MGDKRLLGAREYRFDVLTLLEIRNLGPPATLRKADCNQKSKTSRFHCPCTDHSGGNRGGAL